jgi:serpin B
MPATRQATLGAVCAVAIASFAAPIQAAAAEDGSGPLITAYNSCGQQLFRAFAEKPGNIVLSPYSIGTGMAMALVGARGENEAEMAKVLGLQLPREEVNAANAAALASLDSVPSTSFQLLVANAVVLRKIASAISDDYVAILREDYAAEVFRDADLATVSGWVKEKTDGKIDSILDQLDPLTTIVLVDVIYFKARWQRVFAASATHDETFHLLDGEAEVPTMHARSDFALAERPGYRAIRLPYAGARVGMVVVLPDGNLADVVQRLDDNEMRSLLAALRAPVRSVEVSLPRFQASFKASLVEPFAEMGMHRAFDAQTADFSGMTRKPQLEVRLAIGQIIHRAVIDVTEEGTAAAAATGVAVVAGAMRPQPVETFRVDRPFLFAIVDDETGAILFEGRIVDPRQAS